MLLVKYLQTKIIFKLIKNVLVKCVSYFIKLCNFEMQDLYNCHNILNLSN